METWNVTKAESGLKLLVFLHQKLKVFSLRQLKSQIDHGTCKINGRIERFSATLVGLGDNISFHAMLTEERSKASLKNSHEIESQILYLDDDFIGFNKPAGMISQDPCLLESLKKYGKQVTLLHRLDRDTTGVLLFGRTSKIASMMFEQFRLRKIKKTYFALTDGIPNQSSGLIENYLGKLSVYQGQTIWGIVPASKGVFARTKWVITQKFSSSACIKCTPETGRTHQIRIHLASIGHPILGDHQYGRKPKCAYLPKRMLLHAAEVIFFHPTTKKEIVIQAPLPEDFNLAIDLFRNC